MAKKQTTKKATKMMAVQGPVALHAAVTKAAKAAGTTMGGAILSGLEMWLRSPHKKAPASQKAKVPVKKSKVGHHVIGVAVGGATEKGVTA